MGDSERCARILVVGDSAVGKTALLHYLCEQEVAKRLEWTIGAKIHVSLYSSAIVGFPCDVFLEFWDISGSGAYEDSRSMFFSPCDGIIFVYDLTNLKSYKNLKRWYQEIKNALSVQSSLSSAATATTSSLLTPPALEGKIRSHTSLRARGVASHIPAGEEGDILDSVPIIVVGNKTDIKKSPAHFFGVHELDRYPFTATSAKIGEIDTPFWNAFFDRAVQHAFGVADNNGDNASPDRYHMYSSPSTSIRRGYRDQPESEPTESSFSLSQTLSSVSRFFSPAKGKSPVKDDHWKV